MCLVFIQGMSQSTIIVETMLNGDLISSKPNHSSIIENVLLSFYQEANKRNILIENKKIRIEIVNGLRFVNSYGQCWVFDDSIKIRFDKKKLNQYIKSTNHLKIKYFIFHELAHGLLNKKDNIGRDKDIMNSKIFNNEIFGVFNPKMEEKLLNLLFN